MRRVTAPGAAAAFAGSLRGIATRRQFRADLGRLLRRVALLAGTPVDLSVALLSDPEIARLNARWLKHRGPTDVISFPLSGPAEAVLRGTLAVGVDTALRESGRRGHAPYHELMLYVAHGALHLLGHDDATPGQRARMRRAERDLLAALDLPHVYGEAAARGGSGGRKRRRREGP